MNVYERVYGAVSVLFIDSVFVYIALPGQAINIIDKPQNNADWSESVGTG